MAARGGGGGGDGNGGGGARVAQLRLLFRFASHSALSLVRSLAAAGRSFAQRLIKNTLALGAAPQLAAALFRAAGANFHRPRGGRRRRRQ